MAKGRPSNWAKLEIPAPIWLGKSGISIVVWDKWGRKRTGTLVVSIGGLRWYPYKSKKPARRIQWDDFTSTKK